MSDINPIKPTIELPLFTQTQILVFWGVVGVILAYILWKVGIILYRRFFPPTQQPKQEEEQTPSPNYAYLALRDLRKTQRLIEEGNFHTFYLEATDILKAYLSNIFTDHASDMTTRELLTTPGIPQRVKTELEDILLLIDQAKFAKQHENTTRAQEVYDNLSNFFEK